MHSFQLDNALAIGIDFGTNNVSVAVFRNNNVEVIEDESANKTMPALVAFTDERILIGDEVTNQTLVMFYSTSNVYWVAI